MTPASPAQHYSPDPNIVERRATHFLQRRNRRKVANLHALAADEMRAQRNVVRWAILWAIAAGTVSGAVIGGIEVFVRRGLLDGMEDVGWREQLPYWAAFYAIAAVVSAAEILFLYWNALRGTAALSHIGGVALHGDGNAALIATGLARAALEFPSPRNAIFGIDPYARVPNWRLTAQAILYKAKVGVSAFVVRILARRVLGRMILRGLIPLLTVPLYAIWNAIITWRVMREAKIRAFGPFQVEQLIGRLSADDRRVRPEVGTLILHGAGEAMVRGGDAHPNSAYLLSRLMEELGREHATIRLDWPRQREVLETLDARERTLVLDVLTLACLFGSKVRKGHKEFLAEAHEAGGLGLQAESLKQLRRKLVQGASITREDFDATRNALWREEEAACGTRRRAE
jgi:hypothetical protein